MTYGLPPKRKRKNTNRFQKRFPGHRNFVRGHECCVGNKDCVTSIECAHVDMTNQKGLGEKSPDWETISLCVIHHREQHLSGWIGFCQKYNIDAVDMAYRFYRASPHYPKMKPARDEYKDFQRRDVA